MNFLRNQLSRKVGSSYEVTTGFRQGRNTSPRLFNISKDGVAREV